MLAGAGLAPGGLHGSKCAQVQLPSSWQAWVPLPGRSFGAGEAPRNSRPCRDAAAANGSSTGAASGSGAVETPGRDCVHSCSASAKPHELKPHELAPLKAHGATSCRPIGYLETFASARIAR